MLTFKIRPYFGHDCNSTDGFNNGHYLDTIEVMAVDEDSAIEKAMRVYIKENKIDLTKVEKDGHFGDYTLYSESPMTDSNGNEVDIDAGDFEFDETEHGYTYQYVDFNCIETD